MKWIDLFPAGVLETRRDRINHQWDLEVELKRAGVLSKYPINHQSTVPQDPSITRDHDALRRSQPAQGPTPFDPFKGYAVTSGCSDAGPPAGLVHALQRSTKWRWE